MLLDGSAEGMPTNSTYSLSASDDLQTYYLTTIGAFSADGTSGDHSMVYVFDVASRTFSGPVFSAPAVRLTQKVDALHVEGELP
jgi:hypothetical protein